MSLVCLKSGLLTTVQDLGRNGFRRFGINPAGAMDTAAVRLINLLLGNDENAPVLETRVCQYENTPDDHFLVDRHPTSENTWLVGGGSGHGFKHGPALGEMVAELVMEDKYPDAVFRLGRAGK